MRRPPQPAPHHAASVPTRRGFLAAGGATLAGAATLGLPPLPRSLRAADKKAERALTVKQIERIPVKLPFREVPARNMARELPHWRYFEVFRVRLRSGHVGTGETMMFYTWGRGTERRIRRAQGRNAAALMWDDDLGAGLQIALFDAVARALDVPVHRLLGEKVHNRTPLSWWDIDLPPEDLAAECETALHAGYTAMKTKGRPWFDIWAQAEAAADVTPDGFSLVFDFNDTLLDAERGTPILEDLAGHPQIGIVETPIPQRDLAGNRAIREAVDMRLAMHYGRPDPWKTLRASACDGFVVSGGASELTQTGAVCAMADKPFWLQVVGTGITAAWSLHFGGALSHATWPAVNCHQLYEHDLLAEPIRVEGGHAPVPDAPGLGHAIDTDALQRFRIERPDERPEPPRLLETRYPDGRVMHVANTGKIDFMLNHARRGEIPYFEKGVTTRLLPDDGSDRWQRLYDKARNEGPVIRRRAGRSGGAALRNCVMTV